MSGHGSISYEVAQRVRAAISNQWLEASDSDVAKALGVSRAAVSEWKADRAVMSPDTVHRAQGILKMPAEEVVDIVLTLQIERAPPDQKHDWAQWRKAIRALARDGKAAAIVALAIFAGGSLFPEKPASAAPLPAGECVQSVYYGKSDIKRRRRRWLSFTWFPIATFRQAGPELAL